MPNLSLKRLAPLLKVAFGMASRASNQGVALILTLIAARYLTPTDFGVFVLASILVTVARTMLYTTTFQYVMKTPDLHLYSTECLVVSGLMALVMSVVPLVILMTTNLFGDPRVFELFLVLLPSNAIAAIAAWQEAQLLRKGRVGRYYSATAGVEVIGGVAAALLFVLGFGIWSLVAQIYLRGILILILYALIEPPKLSHSLSWQRTLEIGRWSLPQYASALTGLLSNYGADFIVGAILSPAATGLYRAASRVTSALSDICGQPLRIISMVGFSREVAQGRPIGNVYPYMLIATLLVTGSVLGGLAAVSDPALSLVFGSKWSGIEDVVAILCAGRLFASLTGVTTTFLVAAGRQKVLLPVQLTTTILLVIGLFCVARLGVEATAAVTSLSLVLASIAYMTIAFRTVPRSFTASARSLGAAALPPLASSLLAYAVAMAMLGHFTSVIVSLVAVAAGVVAWLLVVFLLRRSLKPTVKALLDFHHAGPE